MAKIQIAALVAAVALVATVGVTVVATASDSEGESDSFFRHLHELGRHLRGEDHHHQHHMAELIERLELSPDQLGRIERIHEIMSDRGSGAHRSMVGLHERLVAQFEQGYVGTDEVRRMIDDHVERIRHTAYAVTDELIALVNGLDAAQREILLDHLQGNRGEHHAGDHGH